MILEQAKELLNKHGIPFEQVVYENEKIYWEHVTLFPYTANASGCKVLALVIRSKNGRKDIELQFNQTDIDFVFEELRFGGYCYEMFDCVESILEAELLDSILKIMQGTISVVEVNDLKKKRWRADACFDSTDSDAFGQPGFEKAVRRIERRKGIWGKFTRSQLQYEIYNWNTYRRIIK